jgi:hypothetical protein
MTGVAGAAAMRCIRELGNVYRCCTDQSNNNELSEAINSMFRWYRNAVKCYVYLSDVPQPALSINDAFRKSRWFTQGWTRLSFGLGWVGFWGYEPSPSGFGFGPGCQEGVWVFIGLGRAQPRVAKNT